jgi:hypothetical protein
MVSALFKVGNVKALSTHKLNVSMVVAQDKAV